MHRARQAGRWHEASMPSADTLSQHRAPASSPTQEVCEPWPLGFSGGFVTKAWLIKPLTKNSRGQGVGLKAPAVYHRIGSTDPAPIQWAFQMSLINITHLHLSLPFENANSLRGSVPATETKTKYTYFLL